MMTKMRMMRMMMMMMLIVQELFPPVSEPMVHRPAVGDSLTLRCRPPYSYPVDIFYYWAVLGSGERLRPIETNDRVSLDYDGMLYAYEIIQDIYCNATIKGSLCKGS